MVFSADWSLSIPMAESDGSIQPPELAGDACPIFEVHKVGHLTADRASTLSLPEIAKTYSELIPITTVEQFKKASALATVPAPGHMIVDKLALKDLVAKHAADIAARRTGESVQRMENSVKMAQNQIADEMSKMLSLIAATLQTEQANLKATLDQIWNTPVGKETDEEILSKKKLALETALETQQGTLQRIFDLVIAKKSSMQQFEFASTDEEDLQTESN